MLPSWARKPSIVVPSVVAVMVGLSAFFVPEVRYFLGLDTRPSPAPQSQQVVKEVVPQTSGTTSTSTSVAAPSMELPPVNATTDRTIAEVRQSHHVAPMRETESGETLSEVPPGSFGFVYAPLLAYPWVPESLGKIELQAHGGPGDIEIHKLADGHSEVLAYVGPETLERVRHGLRKGEKVTVYTKAWKEAPNLVTLPVARIQCDRARRLESDQGQEVHALDCRAN